MDVVIAYLHSVGLAALIAVAFGVSMRMRLPSLFLRFFIGCLFGAAAMLAMNDPIPISAGVYVDARNLFVGLSAAFLGPVGAIVTLCIAGACRILLGGVGLPAGLVSMTIAATAGLVWRQWMKNEACQRPRCLLVLGGMISLSLVGTTLLPQDTMISLLVDTGPIVVAFNLAGALLFGSLIERERIGAYQFGALEAQATTDPLTGLLNRRGLNASFAELSARGRLVATAILILDLDHFKRVNDSLGHEVGDEVLGKVADVLKRNTRSNDMVSRYGGEEFVIVMPDTDIAVARSVAERLRVAVSHISLNGGRYRISTSIGGFWSDLGF